MMGFPSHKKRYTGPQCRILKTNGILKIHEEYVPGDT